MKNNCNEESVVNTATYETEKQVKDLEKSINMEVATSTEFMDKPMVGFRNNVEASPDVELNCYKCGSGYCNSDYFLNLQELQSHQKEMHAGHPQSWYRKIIYKCELCGRHESNQYNKVRHLLNKHFKEKFHREITLPLVSPFCCPFEDCSYVTDEEKFYTICTFFDPQSIHFWLAEIDWSPILIIKSSLCTSHYGNSLSLIIAFKY